MIGGKSNSINEMYAAGLSAQSSVYGATIPDNLGTTRTNLLLIWMANLRKGSSSKFAKVKGKGGPTYVENVDFLIGTNPIQGVLQIWNNNQLTDLLFEKYTAAITYPFAWVNGSVTVPDPDFYFVIAVTADVALSGTFNDYGGPGSVPYAGTYEMPLWNLNYAGPDPTSQTGYRQFPATYQWIPYSGPTVNFPGWENFGPPGATGTVHIYYAKLNTALSGSKGKGGSAVPLTRNRLTFEPVLGSGTEYTADGANKANQQKLYNEYAGVGSPNLDLGSSGLAPAILPEIVGKYVVLPPRGDCDPPDMIEHVFKSGPAQAGTGAAVAYGAIHSGLGCLDFPGAIQKKILYGSVEPWNGEVSFDLQNTEGNHLFCWIEQNTGAGALSITDTAGNTWIPLVPGSPHNVQLFHCVANAYFKTHTGLNTLVIANYDRFQEIILLEIGGLDTLDGAPIVTQGTGGTYSQAITPTNNPGEDALVLSFVQAQPGTGYIAPPPYHWKTIANDASFSGVGVTLQVDQYRTKWPRTYTAKYAFADPGAAWTAILLVLKNSEPNSFASPLGNILDDVTMQNLRLQCRAYGLGGSISMKSQKAASEYLTEFYTLANGDPVWSGDTLKSIPRAEQSFAGNGAVYISPTASGPIVSLTEDDFIAENQAPPVKATRVAPAVDDPTLVKIEFPNRDSNYDKATVSEPDNGTMTLYGRRTDSPKRFDSIQSTIVARAIMGIMIREKNMVRNNYEGVLQPRHLLFEATDLVTIPKQLTLPAVDPSQPAAGTIPVRFTSISIDENYKIEFKAEPFIYGMRTPLALEVTNAQPNSIQFGADPGSVNAPVILEAPPKLSGTNNLNDLIIAVSAPSPNYGGCVVNISTDGGASYKPLGPNGGILQGNATTGVSTADWPAAADPDTANDLPVDLTESLGSLASYQIADEDNFVYLFYMQHGAGGIAYELGAYALANLTAPNKYTLKATGGGGNHLRRAVYGIPTVGAGVDHPLGSRFAFLDPNNPSAPGILRVPMDPTWIGVTLHFKFQAFNTVGGGVQPIAACTDYTYTPTGNPGCVNSAGATPGVFLVNET